MQRILVWDTHPCSLKQGIGQLACDGFRNGSIQQPEYIAGVDIHMWCVQRISRQPYAIGPALA